MLLPWILATYPLFLTTLAPTRALSSSFTSSTFPSYSSSSSSSSLLPRQDFGTKDITTSGKYEIIFCNADELHQQADLLKRLLPLILNQIERLLLDAQRGTRSRHGFRAFFKTNKARKPVLRIFQDILDGKAVTVSADRAARLGGTTTARPRFACMKEGDARTAHLLEECTRHPSIPVFTWGSSEIVMICPRFFGLPAGLTAESCPKVVGNKLTPDDTKLVESMYGAMIHELVHIYHPVTANFGDKMKDEEIFEEVYDVQKVVELSAKKSLENANNFALYAAGE